MQLSHSFSAMFLPHAHPWAVRYRNSHIGASCLPFTLPRSLLLHPKIMEGKKKTTLMRQGRLRKNLRPICEPVPYGEQALVLPGCLWRDRLSLPPFEQRVNQSCQKWVPLLPLLSMTPWADHRALVNLSPYA